MVTGMMCVKKSTVKGERKVNKKKYYIKKNKTFLRPVMIYGSECWVLNKKEDILMKFVKVDWWYE